MFKAKLQKERGPGRARPGPQSGTSGQLHKKFIIILILTENCCPLRSTSKNNIALAFLKAACPYNPY
jgi:hypothetical protein